MRIFTNMIKLSTPVDCKPLQHRISFEDKTALLGSCFADSMAEKMRDAGYSILHNPFGTLYNPASILSAILRLNSGTPFTAADCVEMGAGSNKICSFEHHTTFARPTAEEFLANANKELEAAHKLWADCNKVIITLGTAYVWQHDGRIVSNCLKRPAGEFEHFRLEINEIRRFLGTMLKLCPDKEFIFTVSPIRHLAQGAHENTLSKALLHVAVEEEGLEYFPAYEIMQDELRDYRYYAEDLVHPNKTAIEIIWERFSQTVLEPSEEEKRQQNLKACKAAKHVRRT